MFNAPSVARFDKRGRFFMPLHFPWSVRDKTGQRYGMLTVVRFVRLQQNGRAMWECKCDCGRTRMADAHSLTSGMKSCGCANLIGPLKHGDCRRVTGPTSEYMIFAAMLKRCNDPRERNYHRYGGRGIRVCDAWNGAQKYPAFLAYIGRRPSQKHSLDRWPDKDGNYEPGNVRWATQHEQMRNTSRNRFYTLNGETLCLKDMAIKHGVNPGTARARLEAGWPIAEAFGVAHHQY